jgi:2-iminobutanoate/2-iminopropanoate deaminase
VTITRVNPHSLPANPAFAQAARTPPGAQTIYVGGQNGVDGRGRVVSDRLGAQTEQALRNVLAVLQAAGATQADVPKLTVHVVAGADIGEAFAASQEVWGRHPTAITIRVVAGLANPDFLVEIDAVAAL